VLTCAELTTLKLACVDDRLVRYLMNADTDWMLEPIT
jgi:hypothetical protein